MFGHLDLSVVSIWGAKKTTDMTTTLSNTEKRNRNTFKEASRYRGRLKNKSQESASRMGRDFLIQRSDQIVLLFSMMSEFIDVFAWKKIQLSPQKKTLSYLDLNRISSLR